MPKISELAAATGVSGSYPRVEGGTTKRGDLGTAAGAAIEDFVPAVGGVVVRIYDAIGGWPIRGTVPAGTLVWWINPVNSTAPTAGGDGYADDDIVTLVAA